MSKLTAIILSYNEELHISRAIASLWKCAAVEQVYVIDSFSSDKTREVAERLGAKVVAHEFVNQAKQLQWALDNIPIGSEWIIRLDADEIIGEDLAKELSKAVSLAPSTVTGFTLNRRHIFLGKWIRHGGRYPLRLLRVWRNGIGGVEDRWMDEHIVLRHGNIRDLNGRFEDRNLNDINFFIDKHNKYASREALELLLREYGLRPIRDSEFGLSSQARIKRILKEHLYSRLPYQLTSSSYFIFRYIFQLGFLDGAQGLVYHLLQGFWYRFLVGVKTEEMRLFLRTIPTREAQINKLREFSDGKLINVSLSFEKKSYYS